MPDDCWVDLFVGFSDAGGRHRFYGPVVLDWLRYEPGERLTVRLGPGAAATLRFRDGREPRTLGPGESAEGLAGETLEALDLSAAIASNASDAPDPRPDDEAGQAKPVRVRASVAKRFARPTRPGVEPLHFPAPDDA